MNCNEVTDRLDDYVDGWLPAGEGQEVEQHLHGCVGCRGEERRLRWLLAEATALPREIQPQRDLWPGIADRIGLRRERVAAFPRRGWLGSRGAGLAAAAAVLVAVSSTFTAIVGRNGAMPAAPAASPWRLEPAALGREPGPVLEAEAGYARATATLMAALDERPDSLAPETRAVVEENLRIIDDALRQVREALRKDPGSRELTRMLTATHKKKVDVLRRVMKLSTPL